MDTNQLWSYVSRIRDTRSGNKKLSVISELYSDHDTENVYWAFRFLARNPLEDWSNDMGVAKKTVRKAAEKAFNIPYDEIRELEKEAGDLSDIFEDLEPRSSLTPDTSDTKLYDVKELGEEINDLANISGDKAKINKISDLLETAENPQVVSYAILGDISIGASGKTLLKCLVRNSTYSRDQLDKAYGLKPDIAKVARDVRDGRVSVDIQLFDRVRPQLAKKGSIGNNTAGLMAQYKYDGARVLIHVKHHESPMADIEDQTEIRAFTRNQNEVTGNLPELHEVDWPDRDVILDTEAVAYKPGTDEPLNYQKAMERFQREKNIEEKRKEIEIKFKVFDILYDEGSVVDQAANFRVSILGNMVVDGSLPEGFLAKTAHENFEKFFNEALDQGHEGIIVKDMGERYHFQRDSSWQKIKPVKEPIDVRVSGVVRGTGEMSDTLGALKIETQDGVQLGRVGTGFTDETRDKLWARHTEEDDLVGNVIEIEFEELQESNGSYGLRFPRYSRRKPTGEADDIDRVKSL